MHDHVLGQAVLVCSDLHFRRSVEEPLQGHGHALAVALFYHDDLRTRLVQVAHERREKRPALPALQVHEREPERCGYTHHIPPSDTVCTGPRSAEGAT